MARHFPIFIDLGGSPPLVIGRRPALAAKLRLLGGFAPQTDLLTGLDTPPPALDLAGVRHITGMPLHQASHLFAGRPLVLIDTGDAGLDDTLSRQARKMGVPVNVPDKPALCSFYLGSIVDRAPVILAISTGGFAPVLAQRLRAAIEDWLPHCYGSLAVYLNRIRHRIRPLPAARRRRLQHRIIDGEVVGRVLDDDEARADSLVLDMLTEEPAKAQGGLHVISGCSGSHLKMGRRQIEAIRNADVILHAPGEVQDIIHLARREVELVASEPGLARGLAAEMRSRDLEVVIMPGGDCAGRAALLAEGRSR